MLMMMDEIFELDKKDRWLRRRVSALLRQIIKTTYGDTINRYIGTYIHACMHR